MFPAPPDLFLQSATPQISFPLSPLLLLAPSPAPLCHDAEGWGPMSPTRYDFTPCFMDLWVALVAGFALLLGPGALWFLRYKQVPQPVGRNWHFYAKLGVLAAFILVVALQASLQIEYYHRFWFVDFRFWSSILLLASACVVFGVQYMEHTRSRNPNGVVLFYWLLLIIVLAVKLRSLISQRMHAQHPAYFVTFCIAFGLACVEFALEYFVPKKVSAYDALGDEFECPYEYADIFSILTFSWMSPLMKAGYHHYLTQDDLWNLRARDSSKKTSGDFKAAWAIESQKKRPSLFLALARAYGGPFWRGGLIKVLSDVSQFLQPQLLRLLIAFVSSYRTSEPQPVVRGCAIALGMFALSVTYTSCQHQYFQRVYETGMRVRSGLTAAIYEKSTRLSSAGRAAKSTGDIVNLMAVDTQRLDQVMQFVQQIWSAPFQIFLAMASLYQLVGPSMFAGVGIMVIMIPINGVIMKYLRTLSLKQMSNKDVRTKLMSEILNNIKAIKLHAWTRAFSNRLNEVRNNLELAMLRKKAVVQTLSNFTMTTTPFFVSFATFSIFALTSDKPLTADLVFPALSFFNLLQFPLQVFPMVINAIVEASVSAERITAFLLAEELQPDAVRIEDAVTEAGEESILVRGGTFTWNSGSKTVLNDINFSANKGELTCILGRVGSGKSSLLQAILGDLHKIAGEVVLRGRTAYVAQTPWIMNSSVKENITFGYRYDPIFYEQTVKACALVDDIAILPNGDETLVGERGISLSGGQKARIALARAVYARADVYILDDVLSAVDQHVGRHIINNVLGPSGLLAGKARVLATNAIPVLREAEYVVLVRDGRILERGTYEQLVAMKGEIAGIISAAISEEDISPSESASPLSASTASQETVFVSEGGGSGDEAEESPEDTVGSLEPIRSAVATQQRRVDAARRASTGTLRRASTASAKGLRGGKTLDEEAGANNRVEATKEHQEQGKVKWSVYGEYASSANSVAVVIWVVALISAQAAQIASSVWLKTWSESNDKNGSNQDAGKYIGIYFAFGIGYSVLVLLQTMLLWLFCSLEASRKLHERMAHAIFRSPMTFFETTPTGRILNRFSNDIYRVDEVIARSFNSLFMNAARAGFTLITVCVAAPAFTALILPLAAFYYYIQRYYLRTSRELKRLDSVSKSPILGHFQESLIGIATIRAYRQVPRFALENEWRVDANMRAYFPLVNANRWLAVRLEFIGSTVILTGSLFAVAAVGAGGGPSAPLLGLAMAYALQITSALNWIVRQTVEVETNIVSVERVLEYANLPSEAPDIISKNRPPISWPAQGAVRFQGYSARYRPELDLVLRDVNLSFRPREKIGVVGRTGAGKSTLTLALFRIIEAAEGYISIDDLDTSRIGLLDLRGKLAIIPQDAALFEGTIRDNLDPSHIHDDTELWNALDHARLKDHVAGMDGKLEAQIHEGGSNLSQGQRQLVSLARALLAPSNILVLDEATAAVDVETDAMLQTTLRSNRFRDKTIITIAHRINTILDSDRIVVLQQGRVAEFDTPANLVRRRGLFYELVREANLLGLVEG